MQPYETQTIQKLDAAIQQVEAANRTILREALRACGSRLRSSRKDAFEEGTRYRRFRRPILRPIWQPRAAFRMDEARR